MSDAIKPALTPEEWESLTARGTLSPHLDEIIGSRANLLAASSAATIAVANWALPDDDPRKITDDDVRLLMGAVSVMRAEADDEWPAVERVAAKLAALLPP